MKPTGNLVADTICHTTENGLAITGAADAGALTIIEATPVTVIGVCPNCGQSGKLRDHITRRLVDLPVVGFPTRCCFCVVGRGNPRSWSGFSG
ncbi:hypothetical protein [Corynebacterium belfantii]|uniref:hypothetical protein n=1 Tax=Corynebacterium belfantii TaxID=2014537 RepID=UPI001F343CF5|nr:hypothetical protein [Corynebacterium belfantii]